MELARDAVTGSPPEFDFLGFGTLDFPRQYVVIALLVSLFDKSTHKPTKYCFGAYDKFQARCGYQSLLDSQSLCSESRRDLTGSAIVVGRKRLWGWYI